jgi:hypothetical protein
MEGKESEYRVGNKFGYDIASITYINCLEKSNAHREIFCQDQNKLKNM